MANKPVISIVTTQCQPQDEEQFNKWYNEVHIPMLRKFKGLKGVARYKAINEPAGLPRYAAIYRFASQKDFEAYEKSSELAAAIKEMQETWGQRIELTSRVPYELIKEW
jgi:uncharacterized protein (TIGR02118 family)